MLELETEKSECLKRVIERDTKERGKGKKQAKFDFLKSWDIYYERFKNKSTTKSIKKIFITKKTNIDEIVKAIFNLDL